MKIEQLECKHRFLRDHIDKKRGVISLIVAITISGLVLMIGVAMSTWIISSFNISKDMKFSAPAYYAADCGIEEALYRVYAPSGPGERPAVSVGFPYLSGNLPDSGAIYPNVPTYEVYVISTTPFRAKSDGIMITADGNRVRRSVEINWDATW